MVKEVRWLQVEQVLLKALAICSCDHCFASRTCDTLAGQKDAQQSCQTNESWQAQRWRGKSEASGPKEGN